MRSSSRSPLAGANWRLTIALVGAPHLIGCSSNQPIQPSAAVDQCRELKNAQSMIEDLCLAGSSQEHRVKVSGFLDMIRHAAEGEFTSQSAQFKGARQDL